MNLFTETSPECVKDSEGPVYYEGQSVSLNCSVGYYGNVPPTLTWHIPKLIPGKLDYSHTEFSHISTIHEMRENFVTSVMNLTLKHMIDGKIFTCDTKFPGTVMTYSCTTLFAPMSVLCKLNLPY